MKQQYFLENCQYLISSYREQTTSSVMKFFYFPQVGGGGRKQVGAEALIFCSLFNHKLILIGSLNDITNARPWDLLHKSHWHMRNESERASCQHFFPAYHCFPICVFQ